MGLCTRNPYTASECAAQPTKAAKRAAPARPASAMIGATFATHEPKTLRTLMKRLSSLASTRPHETGIDRPQRDRLFEIDGGYVIVCGLNAGITSAHQLSA